MKENRVEHPLLLELLAFLVEQAPWAAYQLEEHIQNAGIQDVQLDQAQETVFKILSRLYAPKVDWTTIETTPFVTGQKRFEYEKQRLIQLIQFFFQYQRIRRSILNEERVSILKGMILTRAVDNTLKHMFLSGEFQYNGKPFQGKGFRSLGQEAIYASALRLRCNDMDSNSMYQGDVLAPLIRDLGAVLAWTDDVERALNAQAGKDGPPLFGKDLHCGDLSKGVLPPAAPLAISVCTAVGIAFAIQAKKEDRMVLTLTGEGATSLGEWHEAVNLASVWQLPIVFCVQNNQTALSTPVNQQCRVRTFAEKGIAYGIPSITIDGTNPEDIAAVFGAARSYCIQNGPFLVELICMRMCGHAHHDDMLYIGKEQNPSFDIPEHHGGYADPIHFKKWKDKDPIATYTKKLVKMEVCTPQEVHLWQQEAIERVTQAKAALHKLAWPTFKQVSKEVYQKPYQASPSLELEPLLFDSKGSTYLEAIALAIEELLKAYPNAVVLGEDVAPPYGNAFMLFRHMPKALWGRFFNTPISENAIIGACVGMAAFGLKPVGEMQFNDFVASGFNQLVNNAAKLFYRTGISVPMVLRMPFGGLRHAGPYHSQDTSPWFYRVPGLKMVVPSTPEDARGLLHAALLDPDPVLFYEHIALYREPRIKQRLTPLPKPVAIGQAACRRFGKDLSIMGYGAYVHIALNVAQDLELQHGVMADVLDLRSLLPLDTESIFASVKRTNRVLLIGEDSKTGSILQSIASQIGEHCFMDLDAPVQVLGALDTPVPYTPSLEEAFLLSKEQVMQAALELMRW